MSNRYNGNKFSLFAVIPGFGSVCPLCVDHERPTSKDELVFNKEYAKMVEKFNSCKNVLVKDGDEVLECACCGPKHGRR